MRSKAAVLFCLASLLFLCGCLEFEEQSLSFRYDEAKDTLYIFQDYRGIFGADSKPQLTREELEQLDSVLTGQRTFFFANWMFEYHREVIVEGRKKVKEEAARDPKLKPEDVALLTELYDLLLKEVKIENGPFYYDEKRRLCGVQKVTITNASQIIRKANEFLLMGMKEEAETATGEEKRVYQKAVQRRKEFIRLEENRISLVWPAFKEGYDQQFGISAEADVVQQLENFRKGGGTLQFVDDEIQVSLGSKTNAFTSLTLPMASKKRYLPNAGAEVEKRSVIREKFDVQAVRKEFFGVEAERIR